MKGLLSFLMLGIGAALAQDPTHPDADLRRVTVSEGTNLAATVSPDQRTIVFDLQGTLWSIPFEGGTAKELTDPLLEPARPDYSPRGDFIAFQAYQGGTFHIWTMKPDGSGLRQVTSGHGDDREPRVSPDGTRIVFASDRAFEGSYDIWEVDLASGRLTRRTFGAADEFEPTWSPDGSEIAFISGKGAFGTSIRAVGASGAIRTVQEAPVGTLLDSPSWSPDGRKIAYVQFSGVESHLMVSGAPTGTGADVFPFYPDWLPGNRILYTGDGKIRLTDLGNGLTREIPFQATFALHRPAYRHKHFDLDSSGKHPVRGIVSPALSPDGKRVLFEALNQLWVMDIGGKPRALTHDAFYKCDPAWSPDGAKIAYSSDRDGIENIYVLDLAADSERQVTAGRDSAAVAAAWSPDGNRLAFQDQDGRTYVLDLASGQKAQVIDPKLPPVDHSLFNVAYGEKILEIGPQFAPSKPSWSADGRSLAIAAVKSYTQRFREGTSQILTANLATGAVTYTEPAPFGSISTRGEDGPLYSPDGSAVAFVMGSVLWIRPVDRNGVPTGPGGPINREATDAPTWSGDSRELLYLSNGQLRLIARDGSNLRTVPLDLSWQYESAPARTIIHAGRLWDGRGADERTDVDIVVANHRIESIEPHRERGADPSVRWVDASGLTVIPGLWETHTHVWINGKFTGDRLGRLWLAYGFTELESQGDPAYRAVETRESYGAGARIGPRYFATGEALDGERIYYNFMRPITSEAQLQLELSRVRALDYDLLKTYVRLPHAMQKEAMAFAHGLGIIADSHYMLPGMGYGMDGATHLSATARLGFAYTRSAGSIAYDDVRSLYAASGMFVISTLRGAFHLYREDPGMVDDPRLTTLNPPWDQAAVRAKRFLATRDAVPELGLDSIRKEEDTLTAIRNGGGVTLAGTDSPLRDVVVELILNLRAAVKFGAKPWQALQTATSLPAEAYGVGKDLGTVEPGKLADLAFVAGDPLQDIKDAAAVRYVMKGGVIHSVAELMAPFVRAVPLAEPRVPPAPPPPLILSVFTNFFVELEKDGQTAVTVSVVGRNGEILGRARIAPDVRWPGGEIRSVTVDLVPTVSPAAMIGSKLRVESSGSAWRTRLESLAVNSTGKDETVALAATGPVAFGPGAAEAPARQEFDLKF